MSYKVATSLKTEFNKVYHTIRSPGNHEALLIVLPDHIDKAFGTVGTSKALWESLVASQNNKVITNTEDLPEDFNPDMVPFFRYWKFVGDVPKPLPAIHRSMFSSIYNHIFVYADIVLPLFVGDTYSQLLRVCEVPSDVPFGKQVVRRFEKPYYLRVATNEFGSIEIHIKGDDDESVPFEFGISVVTLHFRQMK